MRALLYSAAQYSGAILGALLVYAVQPEIFDSTQAGFVTIV